MKYSKLRKIILILLIPLALSVVFSGSYTYASNITPGTDAEEGQDEAITDDDGLSVGLTLNSNSDDTSLSGTLQILLVITIISLAPSILVMVTSFTRIIVVLGFTRTAMGTQSSPPNNVLIGLSLFLTLFIMSPVFLQIKEEAIDPLSANEISQEEALDKCVEPLKSFMLEQVRQEDLRLFMDIAKVDSVESADELSLTIV
ncbi:MAG: flagellar biosynthetic protein FliP, partial [Lachnospiraceae bacterium]|nr:flagellar biosynthetic protein FliP [Lachnospiraceae bacterium]